MNKDLQKYKKNQKKRLKFSKKQIKKRNKKKKIKIYFNSLHQGYRKPKMHYKTLKIQDQN